MFKKFFNNLFSQQEVEVIEDSRINNFFSEKKWDSLYYLLESDSNIVLSNTQYQIIANSFISEVKENNYEGIFSKFFINGILKLKSEDLYQLTKNNINEDLKKYLVKEYLRKYSNLNIEINYMEKIHPYESYARYLVKNINNDEYNSTIVQSFKNLLVGKEKATEVEETIYYLSAPALAKNVNFSDIQRNSNISPKVVRNIFSQLHVANKIVEQPKVEYKPIEIDLNNLQQYKFEKDIHDSITNIINEHKKITNLKYNLDGDDKFFLSQILSNYLPHTLNLYLKFHENFRDKVLEGETHSANDLLRENLSIYEKKITYIKNNIINEFKKRMDINTKIIQKLGDNLQHYQNGTSELIDDAPFKAPETEIIKLLPSHKK